MILQQNEILPDEEINKDYVFILTRYINSFSHYFFIKRFTRRYCALYL